MSTITPLPPAPSRSSPTNFADEADAFLSALPTFGTETNVVAAEVLVNAQAAQSVKDSITMPDLTGLSYTSVAIGTGTLTFNSQTGRSWTAGNLLLVYSTPSPQNYVIGTVTSYVTGTGVLQISVNAGDTGGSGTFSVWTITMASGLVYGKDLKVNGLTVGRGNASLSNNSVLGVDALKVITSGTSNSAVGANSLKALTSSSSNTAVGCDTLQASTTGSQNTAIGRAALYSVTTAGNNVAVGAYAATSGDISTCVAVGAYSLSAYTGSSSVAVGYIAGLNLTSGTHNTAIGHSALAAASGAIAYSNTGVGAYALNSVNAGYSNCAVGRNSLNNLTSGYENVAIGCSSLVGLLGGFRNTVVGQSAGNSMTSGNQNTALGYAALYYVTDGLNNTGVGNSAYLSGNYTNSTGLGYNAQVTGSNQIQLGESSTTTCYTNGAVQLRSDSRDKADIRPTTLGLDFIKAIEPVDYRLDMRDAYKPKMPEPLPEYANDDEKAQHAQDMKAWSIAVKHENLQHDGTHKRVRFHHGVVAQQVQEVMSSMGVDFGGFQDHKINGGEDVLSIGYTEFIAPLIKAVQELSIQNAALAARIDQLEAK